MTDKTVLTDEQILDEAWNHGFIGSRPQLLHFSRVIEAAATLSQQQRIGELEAFKAEAQKLADDYLALNRERAVLVERIEELEKALAEQLARIAEDSALLEVARKAIEDELVRMRDDRIHVLGRNNGLVIKEREGIESSVIRFGPEVAVRIGIKAIADSLSSSTLQSQPKE